MHVRCHTCIGGTNAQEDVRCLGAGQHVVVGTPGRVLDMMGRGVLTTANIKMFVLDEADEMLSRGFADQIKEIYRFLPEDAQVYFPFVCSCVHFVDYVAVCHDA